MAEIKPYNLAWIAANGYKREDMVLVKCIDSIGEYGGIPHGNHALLPKTAISAYGKRLIVVEQLSEDGPGAGSDPNPEQKPKPVNKKPGRK